MQIQDDRTPEQRKTHVWLVIGTDRFLSGWGKATGGQSYAAWACEPEHAGAVRLWVEARKDMMRIRETVEPYRPSTSCAHCHIYVVDGDHPALRAANCF